MIAKSILLQYTACAFKSAIGMLLSKILSVRKLNICLISERGNDARDNGYFFYKYMRTNHPEMKCIYIIDKNSADYSKVCNLGETIQNGSLKHYIYLFSAKCLISSHIMGFTPCPGFFVGVDKHMNILQGKKIFLQHGIIKDDIEGLKYPNTKVDLFVCGAKIEYDYVVENYRYPENVVQYTGLARYDNLVDFKVKRQILVMPTWRKWLNSLTEEEFVESEFFKRYSDLLNSEELAKLLEEFDYEMVFYPHYEMQRFLHLFQTSDRVVLASFQNYDVQTLLKESCILITDYSSVYFDFAYMEKPIVFYQFDKEKFLSEHYQKGYIDERLFGIVTDSEKLILSTLYDNINGSFDNKIYINNVHNFFIHRDKNNCERIYNAIFGIMEG